MLVFRVERIEHCEAGFTLLELLIALTLLALLIPMLFGSFRYAYRAWDRMETSEQLAELSSVRSFLHNIIGATYPDYLGTNGRTEWVAFNGDQDSLAFVAPTPAAAGGASMSHFTLHIAEGDHGKKLVMDWSPEFGEADVFEKEGVESATILVDGLDQVFFSYYGGAGNKAAQWNDQWTGRASLPNLVKMRLVFAKDDPRTWPDLVIEPKPMFDVSCIFDPISHACQGRPR